MRIELVREWAGIATGAFAEPRMAEIRANLPQTYFAWSGPTANGSVAYFRIQGPRLVIEYAPQKTVDHVHNIYRDPTNDYGAKFAEQVARCGRHRRRDGTLSVADASLYGARVLRNVRVEIDGQPLTLEVSESQAPRQ